MGILEWMRYKWENHLNYGRKEMIACVSDFFPISDQLILPALQGTYDYYQIRRTLRVRGGI